MCKLSDLPRFSRNALRIETSSSTNKTLGISREVHIMLISAICKIMSNWKPVQGNQRRFLKFGELPSHAEPIFMTLPSLPLGRFNFSSSSRRNSRIPDQDVKLFPRLFLKEDAGKLNLCQVFIPRSLISTPYPSIHRTILLGNSLHISKLILAWGFGANHFGS